MWKSVNLLGINNCFKQQKLDKKGRFFDAGIRGSKYGYWTDKFLRRGAESNVYQQRSGIVKAYRRVTNAEVVKISMGMFPERHLQCLTQLKFIIFSDI